MPTIFCLTVRFLQPTCHARNVHGELEWPPSPLRLFQALVESASGYWNERTRLSTAQAALHWLEQLGPPDIIAPGGDPSRVKYRLYVPDNVADIVAAAWSRGRSASIADYRTDKDVCPTWLPDEDFSPVHYLWPLPDPAEFDAHRAVLTLAARSITHLGWGIDMVAADASVIAEEDVARLSGERWSPAAVADTSLRVPVPGTLEALIDKYRAFLGRIRPDGFHPVPPLTRFRTVDYRRSTDPPSVRFHAFELRGIDRDRFRPFDTPRQGKAVAGMLRGIASSEAIIQALGWSESKQAEFVLGHGETRGEPHMAVAGPRLAFLPLPSIESRGQDRSRVVGAIRRVLVAVLGEGGADDLQRLARLLPGMELIRERDRNPLAYLRGLSSSDRMVQNYTKRSSSWATVSPVVLPGHDDPRKIRQRMAQSHRPGSERLSPRDQKELLAKLDRRIDHLLRKAIRQAGYSEELARHAEIDWRSGGFWPGTELATAYDFPEKLRRYRRLHVRITWRDGSGTPIALPGPICLGGGRFVGLGLFAAL